MTCASLKYFKSSQLFRTSYGGNTWGRTESAAVTGIQSGGQVDINNVLPTSGFVDYAMIEDKINNEIHCWNCLLSILCSFWNETDFPLWVSKFQAQGTRWHCLSCFDILFLQSRSNSEAFVLKLQSGSSGILGTPPLLPPLHILCFPKALLIWILGVIKKSSWKHPIHLKFRFIGIFSQETLVECMTRDPKECKAFKLYIQALRSLADRWHTATRLARG